MTSFYEEADVYCGCCGNEAPPRAAWCEQCEGHVGKQGAPWDRTYFALNGRACPFQVS